MFRSVLTALVIAGAVSGTAMAATTQPSRNTSHPAAATAMAAPTQQHHRHHHASAAHRTHHGKAAAKQHARSSHRANGGSGVNAYSQGTATTAE